MTQATNSITEPVLIKSNAQYEDDKQWNEGIRQNKHPEYELYYLQHNIHGCGFKITTGDRLDDDELERSFANVVGAYMFFSAKHKKEHPVGSDGKSNIADCNACIQDFLSAADAGLCDAEADFQKLILQNGWKQMNEENLEYAVEEEAARLEYLRERETTNGLCEETCSAPNLPTESPTSPPPKDTQPPQENNRFHSTQRRNPPSIILTEVKDPELLSGDKRSLHVKWDEWCAVAFDQHKLPPKFHSSNISAIKRQGRRSICLSFYERPKRYLIDYFLHRMKENKSCVFGKYYENYSPRNSSGSDTDYSTTQSSRPHSNTKFFTPPTRRNSHKRFVSSPQSKPREQQPFYFNTQSPPQYFQTLYNPTPPRYPPLSFDRRGQQYTQHDRLSRVEEQLNKISFFLSQMTMQPMW